MSNVSHVRAICIHSSARPDNVIDNRIIYRLQIFVQFTLKGNYTNHLGPYTVK